MVYIIINADMLGSELFYNGNKITLLKKTFSKIYLPEISLTNHFEIIKNSQKCVEEIQKIQHKMKVSFTCQNF